MFHGPDVASDPFLPGRAISGFRTGPLGMGTVVATTTRVDELVAFYRDVLGFRLSDYFYQAGGGAFFISTRVTTRWGILQSDKSSIHHDGGGEFSGRRLLRGL